MRISVKLGGPLRRKVKGHQAGEMNLELDEGARISQALGRLGLEVAEVRVLMVNGRPAPGDLVLQDGDRLALFPPELAYNNYVAINFFNTLVLKK